MKRSKKSTISIKSLKRKLTEVFNGWVRERDKLRGCISCGGRVQQAGHYWSTSQCPQAQMRYFEKNVNGQCIHCNKWLEGNRQGYREGLIKKYGEKVLQTLDVKRSLKTDPWTRFEYELMIKNYKRKFKWAQALHKGKT